jgi:hypothetical protein
MIDACRSGKPASAPDLLGGGVLERRAADRRDVPEDRFRAARAGRDAFTIRDRSGGPAHSLFTAILLKTLHGDYPEAIETRGAARAVTSAGIYRAMSKHLPAAAASYRLAVEPGLTPGFGPPADVYNLLPAAFAAPELPAPKRLQTKDVLAHGALFGRFFDPSVRSRSNVPARPLWARDDERPRLFRDRQGIAPGIVQGIMQGIVIVDTEPAAPRRIVVSPPARMSFLAAEILNINTERRWSRSAQSYEFHHAGRGRPSRMPASFLIEMDDDLWAGAAAWPGVAIAISRAPLIREVAAPKGPRLIYGPAASGAYEEIFEGCELVLSELSTGLLAYRQAAYIAGLVWHFKQRFAHVNPLLGIVAAYLYDAAGDRDGIRRLASVYTEHGQPVPFDIALLAGVTGRRGRDGAIRIDLPALPARAPRTDEEASAFVDVRRFGLFDARLAVRDAVVAGGFPWLRSGWRVLDLAGFPVHAEVVSLAAHIGPSLFTTLDRTAGRRLAALIERGEV